MRIESLTQLREQYSLPSERAQKKQLVSLDNHAVNFIEKSPFLLISTIDKEGEMDVSPRGGRPGFVKVLNEKEFIIPDSKGNNRLDSLSNIVETGRIGALFLLPGVDETLRVNGSAYVSTDAEHMSLFGTEKNLMSTCVVVKVEEMFLHCAKALMRSKLWTSQSQIDRSEFPTMGQMLKDQIGSKNKVETQEAMIKRYQKDL